MKSGAYKTKRGGSGRAAAARKRTAAAPSRPRARDSSRTLAPFRLKPVLETLEPRLLLSADAFPVAPDLAYASDPASTGAIVAPAETGEATRAALASGRELVFVDPRVPDSQALLAALLGEAAEGRKFEIITLDAKRDGIVQVTAALKSRMQIDAVHFITHGSDGAIQLGGTLLDAKALAANLDMVGSWGNALKEDADLLFYGCDLASTARGRALVDWIADLTGADVAASTDPTGHASKGGDWELEYQAGAIEQRALADVRASWLGQLAVTHVQYDPGFAELDNGSYELKPDQSWGQSFSYDSGLGSYEVDTIEVVLSRASNAPAQTITVSLRSSWNGAPLASASISSTSLTTSEAWYSLSIPAVTLNDSTTYFLRVTTNGDDKVYLGVDSDGTYAGGSMINHSGAAETDKDAAFRLIDSNSPPTGAVTISGTVEEDQTLTSDTTTIADADGLGPFTYQWERSTDGGLSWSPVAGAVNSTYTLGDTDVNARMRVVVSYTDGGGTSESLTSAPTGPVANVVDHTIVVDTTSDLSDGDTSSIDALIANRGADGFVSLREAIIAANNTLNGGGPDRIHFGIAGAGPHTITPASALPTITDGVVIDGTTEPDFAGMPVIVLSGGSAGPHTDGLVFMAGASEVRGLVINRWGVGGPVRTGGSGIVADGTAQVTILGNYIGTDANGNAPAANGDWGIKLLTSNNVVGGASAADRNVISGNTEDGILVRSSSGNVILGNYIGLNASGTAALANLGSGIWVHDATGANTIGGVNPGEGNVISGNGAGGSWQGVLIQNSDGNLIQGNIIGLNAAGTLARPNAGAGIELNSGSDNNTVSHNVISGNTLDGVVLWNATGNTVRSNLIGTNAAGTGLVGNGDFGVWITDAANNTVGGLNAGDGNVIAGNGYRLGGLAGIEVDGNTSTGNALLGNRIYANAGLAIDLDGGTENAALVTANDLDDGDGGPNRRQNYPELSAAVTAGGLLQVSGTLNSGAGTYRIELFASAAGAADPSTHGEAERFLGAFDVTIAGPGSGTIAFTEVISAAVATGEMVTATATNLATRDTSEFAKNVSATAASGGISGRIFHDVDGDADVVEAGTLDFGGARVDLYLDDGDGVIGAGDVLVASATTGATGAYGFAGLLDGTYYVLVDSKTLGASPGAWAEQTFASAGAARGPGFTAAAGALYGGRDAGVSDDASSLATAQHVTRVNVGGASVAGVDYGFSFDVVTNVRGDANDDDASRPGVQQQGTLRQFILNANAIAGANAMRFVPAVAPNDVSGAWWEIAVTGAALPAITDAGTTIDGTAYEAIVNGSVRDANAGVLGTGGTVGVGNLLLSQVERPELEIVDGGGFGIGLEIAAPATVVRDLAIHGFGTGTDTGDIVIRSVDSTLTVVEGSVIGMTADGLDPGGSARSQYQGIQVDGGDGGTIRSNLVGYTGHAGINLTLGATGWTIADNEIRGVGQVNSGWDGVNLVWNSSATIVGNLITGNLAPAIDVALGSANTLIENNTITGNAAAAAAEQYGVDFEDSGSGNVVRWNIISGNTGAGVLVGLNASGVQITENLIFGNTGLGIDLNPTGPSAIGDGVTPNDALPGDADSGPNGLQNYPVLATVTTDGFQVVISGALDSTPGRSFLIEFFSSTAADPSGFGEAERFLGATTVATDAAGTAPINVTLPVTLALNQYVTATATDLTTGETSEFALSVASTPANTPPVANDVVATGNEDDPAIAVVVTASDAEGPIASFRLLALPANGTLYVDASLTTVAAVGVDYAAAGDALTLYFVPDAQWSGTTSFQFTATDAGGLTDGTPATAAIGVAAVNDPPVVSTSGGALPYTENAAATPIDPAVTVSDIDDTTLASATVRITGGYVNGEDVLSFTTAGGITGAWDAPSGTLTLAGPATLADWQTVLQSVAYQNTSENPTAGARTIELVVNDGAASSAVATRTVDVAAVNDAPVASPAAGVGDEDDASIPVTLAGTDVDDAIASFRIVGPLPGNGTLYLDAGLTSPAASGVDYPALGNALTLYFDPDPDWSGATGFQFTATDATGAVSAVADATITVNAVNDAPTAADDGPYLVDEDASLSVTAAAGVLANDADVDSVPLAAVLVAGPANAAAFALNADGSFVYTPRADFYGTDTFTYQAFDGSASSNIATVTITVAPLADDTLVVDTTADVVDGDVSSLDALLADKGADGFVSLREAILAANAGPNGLGPDRILFDIAGAGVHTIDVLSALPTITDAVVVDGWSEPDFAGSPLIELNGATAGAGVDGLRLGGSGSTVRGLVIHGFDGSGIRVDGSGGHTLQGNYIGIDAAGNAALGNGEYGIWLASDANLVGGTSPQERNVISGSGIDGIFVDGASGNVIQGNYIGTNAAGTAALGNAEDGIWLQNASNTLIGGTAAGEGNLISGNDWSGIAFTGGGAGNAIQGNLIGVDATGGALGNLRHGVQLLGSDGTVVGGIAGGAGNVIANNGLAGVSIEAGTGHSVLGNTMRSNVGLGIDIGSNGVTANDAGDLDVGPNQGMNTPVIYSVLLSGGNVTVAGEARPGATVQLFRATADPSGQGEGETLLWTEDATGATPGLVDPTAVQFSFTFAAGPVTAGDAITATATDAGGNTSEFSANAFASTSLPGITVTPTSGLVTDEDGGAATFTVVLDSQPGADVTIALASSNTAEGTVAPAPLVFTSANWNVAQTVTVTGVADFLTDGDIAYAIVLDPATSADAGYNGLDPADVSVTNLDGANDAPVISAPGAQIGAEDVPFVFATGAGNAISIADSDAGPADVLEVTLTATNGTLTLAATAGLATLSGNGSANITMTGTLADINAALDGLTLGTALDFIGTANVSVTASDLGASGAGGPQTAGSSVDVDFVAVNDAPTIDLDADDSSGAAGADYQRTYTEQAGPRLIIDAADAVLGDVDSANLASLTVTITNPDFDGTVEFLSADTSATPLITATYNPATGVLTLNGAAPVADYEQVLRTVRYENTADAPSADPRAITFVASDGGSASNVAAATVTIAPVNDAPTADIAAASYAAVENAPALVLHGTGMSVADVDALPGSIVDVHLGSISGLLYATQGDSGVTVTGAGSPNLTLTGTIAQINALLAGTTTGTVTYVVGSDSPAPTDTLSLAIDDNGATGSGGAQWGWDSVTVDLTAVNDAPIITIPGATATPEDTPLVFSAGGPDQISITDVDAAGAPVEVSLNVTNGRITLATTANLTFSVGTGTDETAMTFTGTVADINAALDGLVFEPTPDFNGSAFLSVSVNDLGNSGLGGPLTDLDFATITVTAVNDAPDGADATVTTPQDTPYVFAAASFGFTDGDAGDALAAVRIDVLPAAGTLTLSGVAVTAGQVVDVADIGAGNLVFTPDLGASGVPYASFDFSVQDSGGAFDASPNTLTVNVATPVNSAPDGTDGTVTTAESTDYVLGVADFGFVDPDAGDALSAVRIDTQSLAPGSTLRLAGIDVVDGQVIVAAAIAAGDLVFTPAPAATGSPYASLTFTVFDTNGPDFDPTPNTLTINVTAPSNDPVNTVPGAQIVNEDTALALAGISVSDPNGDLASVELTAANGTLNVTAAGLASVVSGGPGAITITGSQLDINTTLASLVYQGNLHFAGADVLTIVSTDAGGATDTDTVDITVNPVNDAPTVSMPAGYAVTEGNFLALAGTGLAVGDVDAGAANVKVTLSVGAGLLQASGPPAVAISGSGTPVVTLDGSVADINALLAGGMLNYFVTSDAPPATDTLTLAIDDNGASGAGGPRTASAAATITITAVNDAPVNTLPGGATTLEDTPLPYAGPSRISVTDVDAGGAPLQVTLNASNGVITLGGTAGLAFSAGDGAADSSMTFTGTVAAINAALDGLVFTPDLDYWGLALISMSTSDLGASGAGGAQTDADIATIDVLPVNDAPDGTDTTVAAIEDTPYTFTLSRFGFTDVDAVDGDAMTDVRIDSITLPAGATLQLSGVDVVTGQIITVADINAGNLVFTPVADANGPNYASFTFSVRDSGVPPGPLFDPTPNTMTIDVAPVNDLPIITSDGGGPAAAFTIAENTAAVTTVTATDIDGQPLTYSISGGADAGFFSIDPTTGVLVFSPAPNYEAWADSGADNVYDVTVQVADGFGGADTQAISVTVTDADDAPFALADGYATNEDTPLTVAPAGALANDYDEDGSPVTAALVSGPSYGTLAFNGDGSFVYTPNANFFGTDSFVYRVSDGALASGDATVTITVAAVQDAPTAADGSVTTLAATDYAFTIADFNYSDVDGDPLAQVEITALPASGTLLLGGVPVTSNQVVLAADIAAGQLTYSPPAAAGATFAEQFGFRVHDGTQYEAGTHVMTVGVTVLVTPPPPPPPVDPGPPPPPAGDPGGTGSTTGDDGGASGSAGDDGAVSGSGRAGSGGGESAQAPQAEVAAPDKVEAPAQAADSGAGVAAPSAASAFASTGNAAGAAPGAREGDAAVGRIVEPQVEPTTVEQQAIQAISEPAFREELDKLRRHQEEEATVEARVAGSVFAVSTSLSVGYVIWLLRGGVLLTSLLSSLPAWRIIDPLPVLSRMGGADDEEDDDSLEELVARRNDGPDSVPGEDDAAGAADAHERAAPRSA